MFSIRDWFGPRTSTHAEYKSLVIGLDFLLRYWAVQKLIVRSNSGLLVKQVRGGLKVRDKELLDLKHAVDRLIKQVPDFGIELIPREENKEAIRLSKEGITVIGKYREYEEPET